MANVTAMAMRANVFETMVDVDEEKMLM